MATVTVSSTTELQNALNSASAGDVILLESGSYGAINVTRNFSSTVTVKSIDPNGAVLSNLNVSGAGHVTFEDITVTAKVVVQSNSHDISFSGSDLGGLFVRDSHDIDLQNNDIHGSSGGTVTILDSYGIDLIGNTIRDGVNDLLQVIGNSHHIVIENNKIVDVIVSDPQAHPDLIQMFQDFATGLTPHDIVIRGNLIWDDPSTGVLGAQGIFLGGAGPSGYENILIEQNVIRATLVNGIVVDAGENVVVQDNTMVSGIIRPGSRSVSAPVFSNNIAPGYQNDSPVGWVNDHNFFFQSGANQYAISDLFPNYTDGSSLDQYVPGFGTPIALGSGYGAEELLLALIGAASDGTTIASDDVATATEDGSILLTAQQLLANDTSFDGDPLAITSVSDGAHGTAALNADGSVTYTPDADFNGEDAFTYTVSDGNGGFDTASVAVTVSPSPDAPVAGDDSLFAQAGTSTVLNVLANDADPDGDALTITAVTNPANGSVVVNANGTLTYTPAAGFTGTDTFSYTVSDGNGGTDAAQVSIVVDDLPTPILQQGSMSFNGNVASAVILPYDPSHALGQGTLTIAFNADALPARQGLLTKDASGYGTGGHVAVLLEGNDLVVRLQSATETFVVSAPDAIVAGEDYHMALSFGPGGMALYLNGELVDTDAHTGGIAGNEEPIVIGANDWASTANSADKLQDPFDGTIGLVQLYDQRLSGSDIATLAETGAAPTTSDPAALNDAAATDEDTPVTIDVLANDSDPDGDALTVSSASAANGTVVVNPDDTLTYTPGADFNGSDTITYTVSDGNGGSSSATVAVTVAPVNDAPVANGDTATTNSPVTIDVLANDTDADGDPLIVTSASAPNGDVVINADNTVTYNPHDGFYGVDTLTYTISDGNGGSATATVAVTTLEDTGIPDPVFDQGSASFTGVTVTATEAVSNPPLPSETV